MIERDVAPAIANGVASADAYAVVGVRQTFTLPAAVPRLTLSFRVHVIKAKVLMSGHLWNLTAPDLRDEFGWASIGAVVWADGFDCDAGCAESAWATTVVDANDGPGAIQATDLVATAVIEADDGHVLPGEITVSADILSSQGLTPDDGATHVEVEALVSGIDIDY